MSSPPEEAVALFHAGTHLMDEGKDHKAKSVFCQALSLSPDFAEAHANLGLLLDRTGSFHKAEYHYRQALALSPRLTQACLNLAALLEKQKRFGESEKLYRRLLSLSPESPAGWSNLGVLLAGMKREEEAEQCYRKALGYDACYRKARFNLAYLLLRQGRFEEGWACLEARDWYAPLERHLACPRWQGEPLVGKSLLIGFEAGHGDMIQFCRYVSLVRQQGAERIAMLCHPGLKALFSSLPNLDEVIAFDEPFSNDSWDYWTPPLSLPFLFRTRLESIPAELPYLKADPERVAHWRNIIGHASDALRIGLAWKGNPDFENDAERSLPSLETLAPLGEVENVFFFSMQKGAGEAEAEDPSQAFSLVNLSPSIRDFADTAAIVTNLDLVITVDTAVAHLTGALGRPCWVLLPDHKTDWRWLTDRDDSPWYPDIMRLFRQEQAGQWQATVTSVQQALQTLVGTKKPPK